VIEGGLSRLASQAGFVPFRFDGSGNRGLPFAFAFAFAVAVVPAPLASALRRRASSAGKVVV